MSVEVISIVVPVYNVENYLPRCLESLVSQSYPSIEVILVNDGSKDNSLEICESYSKQYPFIKVINKPNEGVAVARNTGLKVATGTYIGFMDPDDWLEPKMYESLYQTLKESEGEICLCNFFKDSKNRSTPKRFAFKKSILEDEDIVELLINDMIGIPDILPTHPYVMGCVWRGLYEKAFLDKHQLCFEPGITIMEDLVFMVKALLRARRVAIDPGVWYHYVQNPSSVLHSYNQKMWEDQMQVFQILEEEIRNAQLENEMRNRLDLRYIGMLLSAIVNETAVKKDLKTTMANIKTMCLDDRLRLVLERVKPILLPDKASYKGRQMKKVTLAKKPMSKSKNFSYKKWIKETKSAKQLKEKKQKVKQKVKREGMFFHRKASSFAKELEGEG